MEVFLSEMRKLGETIGEQWSRGDKTGERFSEIASLALNKTLPLKGPSPRELLLALSAKVLPYHSHFPPGTVSSLALTVFEGEDFHIDLFLWDRKDTVIHDHHFSGAFTCLAGKNHEFHFSYEEQETLGPYSGKGLLKQTGHKIVAPGDVERIIQGKSHIHMVLHDTPWTMNLIVRTKPAPEDFSLSTYFLSGFRFNTNDSLLRKMKSLITLGTLALREGELSLKDWEEGLAELSADELTHLYQIPETDQLRWKERILAIFIASYGVDLEKSVAVTEDFARKCRRIVSSLPN